jgi:hypothetical protein
MANSNARSNTVPVPKLRHEAWQPAPFFCWNASAASFETGLPNAPGTLQEPLLPKLLPNAIARAVMSRDKERFRIAKA